jgi:hypothetical protein
VEFDGQDRATETQEPEEAMTDEQAYNQCISEGVTFGVMVTTKGPMLRAFDGGSVHGQVMLAYIVGATETVTPEGVGWKNLIPALRHFGTLVEPSTIP